MTLAIETTQLQKRYGETRAVDGISLAVRRANVAVCQAPYRNLTHIRRTLLGADWLDPFQGAGPPEAGPGPGGLDALAALLS